MSESAFQAVLEIRAAVGCAAEASRPPWWSTQFFTEQSEAFLQPIFPRSQWGARLHALTRCASRVHDERIGVNQHVFHLFRLPEVVELQLSSLASSSWASNSLQPLLGSPSHATSMLAKHAGRNSQAEPGPVRLGDLDSLLSGAILGGIASAYLRALTNSYQAFPFVTEAR